MPAAPSQELARTSCTNQFGIRENCATDGHTAPELACLPNRYDPGAPATPPSTTLTGYVKVFSAGPSSDKIKVEVFRMADLTSAAAIDGATPIGQVVTDKDMDVSRGVARACPQPEQGTPPPPCVVPSSSCSPGCASSEYCDGTVTPAVCVPLKRYETRYEIANVPTNTPLVIRTTGMGGATDANWAPMVFYRLIASTADGTCRPGDASADSCWQGADKTRYEQSVAVISRGDYVTIPTSVGLPTGISPGSGAVAGEVRDCQNVRIANASVGYSPVPDRFAYFNSNPFMTLPVNGKVATDALGLFSGMNLKAGAIRVRASGRLGGQDVDLGGADAIIFRDSVTIVTINAGRPIDQPPAP
jgi:hypothetical protein